MSGLGGLVGLLVLMADVRAIVNVMGSGAAAGGKVIWVVVVVLLPVIGLIAWLVAGPRSAARVWARPPEAEGHRSRRYRQQSLESHAMNWDQIEGNWKTVRGKVQEHWGKLTGDEIDRVEGKRDRLVGRIQERYGIAREEAERQVRDWERSLR